MSDNTADIFSAARFRQALESSPYTGKELSAKLGVSANTVSGLSTGRKSPSLELLGRIAQELGGAVKDYLDLPPADRWQLRHYRVAAGLTQSAVAERLGVTQSAVSVWEVYRARPADEVAAALAAMYDVSPATLHDVIDAGLRGPADGVLSMAESVQALAQEALHSALQGPRTPRRDRVIADVRARVIGTLEVLNLTMQELGGDDLARAESIVAGLSAVLADSKLPNP